ncbi:MAG: tRNA ((37)-N6)-threonylcarbamoyltransferase complex ATPase subunit type 1 TsaE [Sphingobacteriales bacterium]|nr:tRNA ((37)-N6)-threonylcarbamoyltransferase complex ATPase subunit type 1 TsaE [Sphingobacteriales bacterium]
MNYIIETIDDLPGAASQLLNFAEQEKVFLFSGDMGAGKTTFIKSICSFLGVNETVTSPTYSLVNQYEGNDNTIYHFDFYRIKTEGEAYDIGFEEYLYSGSYCFIEWPEKIENLWPDKYVKVSLSLTDHNQRLMNAALINR